MYVHVLTVCAWYDMVWYGGVCFVEMWSGVVCVVWYVMYVPCRMKIYTEFHLATWSN